jgi:hypothetical protein
MSVIAIRAVIIVAVFGLAIMLLMMSCTGAYRMREPLGPLKGDRLPVCDHAAIPKTCERT